MRAIKSSTLLIVVIFINLNSYGVDFFSLEKNTLNLDITAMIAYVSSLSNGHQNFAFKEPIIDLQATTTLLELSSG